MVAPASVQTFAGIANENEFYSHHYLAEVFKGDIKTRIEAIGEQGGDAFSEYQVPLAILAMLQGLGRLIRHRSDRGVLAVLDPRLKTMGYGRRFLDSFTPAPITHDMAAVTRFFDR